MAADDPESWLFALLTYQTTSGFLGAGNYGSIRMNGGFGSRAFVSLVEYRTVAGRFREELDVLGSYRDEVLAGAFGFSARGCVLTWTTPWSRQEAQWPLSALEPWFIEAVRPVRLQTVDGAIEARGTTSKARQIGPKAVDSGDVGDPWHPVNLGDKKKGQSALTIGSAGWSPEILCRLLFQQDIRLTPLQRTRASMVKAAWFIGSVLVRGQGTTDGFRHFEILVPARVRSWLGKKDERESLAKLGQTLLGDAKEVEKTLRAAIMALASGGPAEVDLRNDTMAAWARTVVDQEALGWSDRFFPTLWRATDESHSDIRENWCSELVSRARTVLRDAERRIPLPTSRRYRAAVRARGLLEGGLRKKGLITSTPRTTTEEVAI
jgi:CRISPR system Cascade subunit CasA